MTSRADGARPVGSSVSARGPVRGSRAPVVAALLGASLLLLGGPSACGPASRGAKDASGGVTAKNLVTSDGVVVTTACMPTGPEICFNAQDDNCNGVIDEGCGVRTGVLQFTIAWGDSDADVDLAVTDPSGTKTHTANRSPASGLELERNCPDEGCHGQNVENIVFEGLEPPRGRYTVEVKLTDPRGAELPVKVHLSARVGSRTFAMDLEMSPGGPEERQGFAFDL